jgi:hypothetical protein
LLHRLLIFISGEMNGRQVGILTFYYFLLILCVYLNVLLKRP